MAQDQELAADVAYQLARLATEVVVKGPTTEETHWFLTCYSPFACLARVETKDSADRLGYVAWRNGWVVCDGKAYCRVCGDGGVS